MKIPDHQRGLWITLAGIIALSPDSLLVRLIPADQWTLLFWRGLLSGGGIALLGIIFHGRDTPAAFRRIGKPGLVMAVVFSTSTILFVTALHFTSVANTLILAGTAPIFAALLSRVFLSEQVQVRTWITLLIVVASVTLIVSDNSDGHSLSGDLSALACAFLMALTFIITRRSRAHDMTPAMALSGFITALVVLPFATPFALSFDTALMLVLLGLLLAVAFALLTIGPRYITAPEVSMMMPLETVFGTLLVWLWVGEVPTVQAVIGGVIIVTALATHAALALKNQ